MIFGYKTKNDRKIEELERESKYYKEAIKGIIDGLTKKRKIEADENDSILKTLADDNKAIRLVKEVVEDHIGLCDKRLQRIESIGDFEVLMKRITRVEEQFGPIMGKVNDTYSSAMQSLISEAAKTNQHMVNVAKDALEKAFENEAPEHIMDSAISDDDNIHNTSNT